MASKYIGKILSGGVVVLCIVVFCTLDIRVHAQTFTAEKVTYTISGSVGLSGVTMTGLNVITDENGNYIATVDHGWTGTVTPKKAGYTFQPPSKTYAKVTSNQVQDYTWTPITYTISGTTRMEGVTMMGLPGNPVTDATGAYSETVEYAWSGTVIPTKTGYKFTPDKKAYLSVTRDQTNQNYTGELISFEISGSVGVPGVVMDGLPGNIVSDKDGNYKAIVQYGWGGMVTPKREGYTFEPPSQQYTELTSALPNEDYIATVITFTIAGTAGMDGVTMKGLPGNPVSDASGYYSATVEYGFTNIVTPEKPGFTFKPASTSYSKVVSDRTQNYSATAITLTISGTTRVEGVQMNGLPDNPLTGRDGSYKAQVEYGWTGTVVPLKEGYTFTPDSKAYPAVTSNLTSENYIGALKTYTISGTASEAGVTMSGLPGNVVTRSDGTYSANIQHGWSGTVTPRKAGYNFEPASIPYTNVTGSLANENYLATLQKRTISGRIASDKAEPIEDVSVVASRDGGSATTNANGEYELLVDYGWSGTIAPMKDGHTFRPSSKPYSAVTRDQTNQAYVATLLTFTISGTVDIGGEPIPGVEVTASEGGGSTTTDARGRWTITVPYNWSGDITPKKEGFNFSPPSQTYSNVKENWKDGAPVLPTPRVPPTERIPPERVPPEVPPERVPPEVPPERVPPEEAPKTPLEEEMAKMRERMEEILRTVTRPEVPPEEIPIIEPTVAPEPLISNTFADDDLVEALKVIASQAGVAIIPDETVVGTVTCDLRNVPLDTALEIVLAGTNYVVKKTPYYYLVCSGGLTDTMFPVVSETRRVRLNYVSATTAVGLLSVAFRSYVQAEAPAVAAPVGTETHTVCVTAPPALMDRIVADLKKIDQPPRHVLLDARVVVMERGNLLNLGVEWGWPKIGAGVFSNDLRGRGVVGMADFGGTWPWGVQIGYAPDATFTGALELTLNLLSENGEAKILSKPQVLAQDGKVSQINVMTEEWYMMTAPELGGFYYTRAELQSIESGTSLSITPYIGDNNDITLAVAIEVSDSIPRGRGSELPVITRRTSTNTVRIKSGGTVAVAGLTEDRSRMKHKWVPGLGDLPIVGSLFHYTERDESNRQIAVFITATLVPETSGLIDFTEPSTIQAPVEPMQEEFRARLQESLSRPPR